MKKVISLFLAIIMVFSVIPFAFAVEITEIGDTKYPIILVPGYTSSKYYRLDETTGEKIPVWLDPLAQITSGTNEEGTDSIKQEALRWLATGDVEPFAQVLGGGFRRIFADLACGPDGQSLCKVYNYVHTPEETNYKNLSVTYPDGTHKGEPEIAADFAKVVGEENLFVFTCDFRMGAVENANSLREYIDGVIEYTNSQRSEKDRIDKVNIFALSHGGQITGTYLTLYGYEGKVNNAVLTVPALAGAGIAYDAFNGEADFQDEAIMDFVEHTFLIEEDIDILFEANKLGFLDDLVDALLIECMDIIGTWGSLWDFIPLEYYDELKQKRLDEEVNKVLIEQSDFVHYEIMSEDGDYYYAKGFKKAQDAGVKVYIMAGYDVPIVSGMQVSSDFIIPIEGATGATAAPFGQRFSDGYIQKVDTGFYQVSPSMTIDASTSYLPEHTWFIEEYQHGMTYKDEYTRDLLYTLLFNDGEGYSVHSFPEFPQFHATTNPAHVVFAAFDSSKEGFISSEDTCLEITNISYDSIITVSAVNVSAADICFGFIPFILRPGESRSIPFKGEVPSVSLKNIEVNVTYFNNKVTPVCEREFDFTIMNGDSIPFDAGRPLCDADYPDNIENVIDTTLFEIIGIKKITSYFYNAVSQLLRIFSKLIAIVSM